MKIEESSMITTIFGETVTVLLVDPLKKGCGVTFTKHCETFIF